MFSLFKKAPFTTSDKVWMTKAECCKGLATEALKAITRTEIPIVISFFDDAGDDVEDYFRHHSVPYVNWSIESMLDNEDHKIVFCSKADQLEHLLKSNSRIAKSKLCFLLYGHHPLIAPEEHLLSNLHTLTKANYFLFFISLDNPLMETFGVDHIKSLMGTLGIKPDECIEHAMVTKSITRAREKMTESVKHEVRSPNEREWYAKNVK
jgi:hypothetical protein